MTARRLLCCTVVLVALSALPAFAADGDDVRVVRLSLAQGDVQIDRNTADGWEQAINNMPLIGGSRVYAAENSKAEIEFEDGSSIRLVGPAQISLNQLSLSPDGSPVDQVEIDSGLVYINALLTAHADFRIQDSSGESFAITQPSHLRFKVDEQVASLAVIDGEVQSLNDAGQTRIRRGESLNYILGQPQSSVRMAKVPPEGDDGWDQQRDRYDEQYAPPGAQYSGSDNPDAYGVADLGYYGSYEDIPGYGEAWQPAGVDADWDPFDNGAWSYYPDWGWTFVSGYPWGWAPFYFGNWCYIGGRGWWWRPGPWRGPHGSHGLGSSHGLGGWHPQPLLAGAPAHGFRAPHPPAGSTHRTVAVAGSNLRVGPIGVTHATTAQASATHTLTAHEPIAHETRTGSGSLGTSTNLAPGRATSNLAHGAPAANRANSLIGGQRGAYYVNRSALSGNGGGGNGYELYRPESRDSGLPRGGTYSNQAPRAYTYAGSPAPRAYSVPSAPIQHAPAAPPVSSATHIGGAGSSGGFHGGGVSGGGFSGGGFHGGGGHR